MALAPSSRQQIEGGIRGIASLFPPTRRIPSLTHSAPPTPMHHIRHMRIIRRKKAEICAFGTSVPYPLRRESLCRMVPVDQMKRPDVPQTLRALNCLSGSDGPGFECIPAQTRSLNM